MLQGRIKVYNRWMFLMCDHSLGKYYRSLFYLTYLIKLQRPSNDEHITVVSQWDNKIVTDLKNLDDTVCAFNLLDIVYTNGNAFWVDVVSEDLTKLRANIGLPPNKEFPLHFCFGYLNEGIVNYEVGT